MKQVVIQDIFDKWNNYMRTHFKSPDNVMLHPCQKRGLTIESYSTSNTTNDFKTCFGMKLIWTYEIGENDVICTINC